MTNELLIEIGTEELPAGVINPALDYLKDKINSLLNARQVKTYGTPRRLTLYFKDFENERKEKKEVIWGPPKNVAYDEKGNPTKALEGFLKKNNASLEEVKVLKKDKGEYVAIVRKVIEKSPIEKLQEEFEEILLSVPFPKRMRWTSSKRITFSRPVRWILALFNGQVLKLRFGELESSNKTYGHRFLSKGEVTINNPADYEKTLKEHYVIPDFNERKEIILRALEKSSQEVGGKPSYPEGLVEEVTNLVEYPFPVLGKFDEKYLELPPLVITTVAAHHQRFFCFEKDGKLLNYFLGISNNKPNEKIKEGYEKVLRARLEDALFFYREDLKKDLKSLIPELKKVLFHPKVGSMYEKEERMEKIAQKLCPLLKCEWEKVKEAVWLSKVDLLTEMVKELDELQGYMGYVYAKAQGYDEEVAKALWEQYFPRSLEDKVPETTTGTILSLSDKIDNLYSFFKAGEIPKGSSDPYGLRRSAFGIIKIVDVKNLDLNLEDFKEIYGEFKQYPKLVEFLKQRLISYLEDYPVDIVRAVLNVYSPMEPYKVINSVRVLYEASKSPEFPSVVEAAKRVIRIIPKDWKNYEVDEKLLSEEAERELYQKLTEFENKELKSPLELLPLKEYIDKFFDNVKVMAEDEKIRNNRISLLKRVENLFRTFGDFNEIVIKEG
ncbi:glycine--tRNA ligase subunit beta [Aquifex aeolicus]|uniref:Glycine--tRNA ligase beta subunit n=1 Tax=Aquifex aeolicus (strain VF5) TaxID=224324 RepID=SYGB_AQUAE|nr:glycine--tRNA ligase subunit beta [Aquifex aeolicus]O67898.1 RecName: Full=Glycine--tRNA ligase beta subunit; AltName: Full=Glycyl-tRNA synthetase beta subunit; Short=GlyRS [Aquifex aeolicus VF5]AAC07870.1 glycyl-tRNA synthetase beta subunit [Aquifex aeolicus VF5]